MSPTVAAAIGAVVVGAASGWLASGWLRVAPLELEFLKYRNGQAEAVIEIANNTAAEIVRQQAVTAALDARLLETTYEIDTATRGQRDTARELARVRAEDRARSCGMPAATGTTGIASGHAAGTGLRLPAEGTDRTGDLPEPLTDAEMDRAWDELAAARKQAAGLKQAHEWSKGMRVQPH
ncbi:MAG: hypothetical protein KIT73_02480 [Burkholderiales bacterium]|nr:hypothetical protein [Burkholderiales bacterium]